MVTTAPGSVTLHLPEVLDIANADDLRAIGEAATLACGDGGVILDFADVEFVDSSGLGALVRVQVSAEQNARPLVLLDVSARVRRVVELSGLGDVFEIRTSAPDSPGS